MTTTERIKALEDQLKQLQLQLNNLNNEKLQVIRSYTGEIFSPFEGTQYRRLVSSDVAIWEQFDQSENNWIPVSSEIQEQMESIYQKDC
jgi:hypothetical protein